MLSSSSASVRAGAMPIAAARPQQRHGGRRHVAVMTAAGLQQDPLLLRVARGEGKSMV